MISVSRGSIRYYAHINRICSGDIKELDVIGIEELSALTALEPTRSKQPKRLMGRQISGHE